VENEGQEVGKEPATPSFEDTDTSPGDEAGSLCPNCHKETEEEWLVCQYCMSNLKERVSCPSCGKAVAPGRMICPACTTDLTKHGLDVGGDTVERPEHGTSALPESDGTGTAGDDGGGSPDATEERSGIVLVDANGDGWYDTVSEEPYAAGNQAEGYDEEYEGDPGWSANDPPRCPVCDMVTQYSEEEDDYYCWICERYISDMR